MKPEELILFTLRSKRRQNTVNNVEIINIPWGEIFSVGDCVERPGRR